MDPHQDYWDRFNLEVKLNEGRSPTRSWKENPSSLTQHRNDGSPTEPMEIDEKEADRPGSPDNDGWKELVIDLGDSFEAMNEKSKVNKIKNKVV